MLRPPAFAKRSPPARQLCHCAVQPSWSRLTTGRTWPPLSFDLLGLVTIHQVPSMRRLVAGAPSDVLPIPRPLRPAYRGRETRTSPAGSRKRGPGRAIPGGVASPLMAARPWLEPWLGCTASITGIAGRAVSDRRFAQDREDGPQQPHICLIVSVGHMCRQGLILGR